jgi:hypothetical protein
VYGLTVVQAATPISTAAVTATFMNRFTMTSPLLAGSVVDASH